MSSYTLNCYPPSLCFWGWDQSRSTLQSCRRVAAFQRILMPSWRARLGGGGFPWWESPASPATPGHHWGHSTAQLRGAAQPSLSTWPKSQRNSQPRTLLELENCVNLDSGRLAQSNLFYSRKICDQVCILHCKKIWSFWFALLTSPVLDFTSLYLTYSRTSAISELVGSWQYSSPSSLPLPAGILPYKVSFLPSNFLARLLKGNYFRAC